MQIYPIASIWSNFSDLTRPHPKWWFSKALARGLPGKWGGSGTASATAAVAAALMVRGNHDFPHKLRFLEAVWSFMGFYLMMNQHSFW